MAAERYIEEELFTEVTRLPEDEFIDRYAGILGLRDNVKLALSLGVNETLYVTPDTYESRIEADEAFRASYRRIGAPELVDRMDRPVPPQEPMSDEEVAALADRIKSIKAKQEAYANLGSMRKIGHNLLFMFGCDSFVISAEDARLVRFPAIIEVTKAGAGVRETIINVDAISTSYGQ